MSKRAGKRGRGGYSSYNNGNPGGFYQNHQYNNGGGYGGGYGNQIPAGVNQFGFSIGRGGGSKRGNNRGNYSNFSGGNSYNYNNNPEWYSNGSYGDNFNNGGFDDGAFAADEGYVFSHDMPFPFKRRGGRGGVAQGSRNMVWQRGMPQWRSGPKKEFFKKKWQNKKKEVAKPVAVLEAGGKKGKKKKSVQQTEARVIKFKEMMTLKNKYRSVRQNKNLSPDDQLVLVYLKKVAHESSEGDEMIHFINFSKMASRHPNALKLFVYEAKKQLDAKYDPNSEEEKEKMKKYLQESKEYVIDGFKKVYKQRAADEDMDAKEKLLESYVAKLSGETFTNDDIPVDEDYLFKKDHSRLDEDFITEFKYDFMFSCFECFKFKPNEHKTHTKDLGKRLRFHLDSQIVPFLIVESVRDKALVKSVPSPINQYIFQQSQVHQDKNESSLNDVVEWMVKSKENVVTPLSKYIDVSAVSTDVIRDFADCILLFDRFITYMKYRMLKYSPHILLSAEIKEKVFNELVDKMYREVLDIIIKKESFKTKVFAEMEKDEGFKEKTDEVKEEPEDEMKAE